jgi:hypothetical protein
MLLAAMPSAMAIAAARRPSVSAAGIACDRAALRADPSLISQGQDSLNPDGEERGNPARLEPRGRKSATVIRSSRNAPARPCAARIIGRTYTRP